MTLKVIPMTIREAKDYVTRHHRHHKAPVGALFAIGLAEEQIVVGVAMVGRPIARHLNDGWTAEITRLCTDGSRNACSMLYGACWRAARALGWRCLITYTLPSEGGASLRGAGWVVVHKTRAHEWSCPSRPRVDTPQAKQQKLRWERRA